MTAAKTNPGHFFEDFSLGQVFAPPAAEVAFARKIIAAFAQPESKGKGVITVEGRMVELLHAEMAARTVAIAEAIERMRAA